MSRKLETEQEKVLPFYSSSLTPEEEEDVAAAVQETPSELLSEVQHTLQLLSLERGGGGVINAFHYSSKGCAA